MNYDTVVAERIGMDDRVVLSMSFDHAQFFVGIMNRVGGCPRDTERKYALDFENALARVKIKAPVDFEYKLSSSNGSNRIYFQNGETYDQ